MFELNGETVTVEMLQAAATKYNMSYDEYLVKMKEKGLKDLNAFEAPEISQTSQDIVKATSLNDDEIADINNKFGTDENPNFEYLQKKERAPGWGFSMEEYYDYEEDLNYSKSQIDNIKKQIVKKNPNYTQKEIDRAILSELKHAYTVSTYGKKMDKNIMDTLMVPVKIPGIGITPDITVDAPYKAEFEKQKEIVQKDVDNYLKVSDFVNKEYDSAQEIKNKVDNFMLNIDNKDYQFNIEGLQNNELIQLKDKRLLSIYDYNDFLNNIKDFNAKQEAIQKRMPYLQKASKTFDQLAVAADYLGRDYDLSKKFAVFTGLDFVSLAKNFSAQTIRSMGAEAVLGLMEGKSEGQTYREKGIEMLDTVDVGWDDLTTGIKRKYAPDVKFKDAFKKGNFGRFFAQELSSQIPIITTMIGSGAIAARFGATALGQAAASGATIGTASAGEQFARMTVEDVNNPFISYSNGEKFLTAAGYGAAEGLLGTAPSYLFLKGTYGALTSNTRKLFGDSVKTYWKNQILIPPIIESGSEALTQWTQNKITGRPAFEGIDHAAFSGAMFGLLMNSAPAIAGTYMQKFGDIKQYETFRSNVNEMQAINIELGTEGIGPQMDPNSVEANSLSERYNDLYRQNIEILNGINNNIQNKVSKYAFQNYLDITTRQESLRAEAESIINSDLSFFQKEKALNKLQGQFDLLQNVRDRFRNTDTYGNEFSLLEGTDKTAYDNYFIKAKEELGPDAVESSLFEKASELYFSDVYDQSLANLPKDAYRYETLSFNTNEALLNYIETNNITLPADIIEGINNGNLNGFETNVDGKSIQILSKENSVNNERAGTGYHEMFHGALFESFGKADYTDVAEYIINWTKANAPKMYKQMFEGIGTQAADIRNAEEIVVNFLERVAEGKIKYQESVKNKSFLGALSNILSLKSGLNQNFKSQNDAINSLINFATKIKDGTFKKGDIEAIKVNLKDAIKKADQTILNIPKINKSDADAIQTMFNNKGENAVFEIAGNKYIDKILENISNKYRDVPKYNEMKEDFELALISDPTYGILGSLMVYDAKKNPVLASHIIDRLKKKSITIAEKIFETKFTEDVSVAKKVVSDVTDPEILEQRESLRTSLGLTQPIIDKVKNAVIKTFGTRLPSIDSKTFRKKLQDGYRVELKPTIATFLGKGNDYRKFLEDNFELVYSILPQSTLNKRFKDFIEPVADETGKQLREKTAEGKKIFKKKKITKDQFINYFLGDDVGASTKGTRKTALSEALAQEIAFDATLDVLRQPEIYNKVQTISEMQGHQFNDNYISQVAKEIDRATDFKFSDSGITQLLEDNNGEVLQSDFPAFWNSLIKNQGKYDINVKNRKGQALEYYVAKNIEALVNGSEITNIEELKVLKLGNTGVDVQFKLNGKEYGFEIKDKISDRIGSANGFNKIKNTFSGRSLNEILVAADVVTQRILNKYKEITGKDAEVNTETGAITVDKTINGVDILKLLGNIKNEKVILQGVEPIVEFYANKGDQYMYFDDLGLFSLASNPFGLNVPSILDLNLNTLINVNISSTQSNDTQRTLTVRARLNFEKPTKNKIVGAPLEILTDINKSESINVDLDKTINEMIERKTGIEFYKVYSKAKGELVGKKFGKGNVFIPWSAEDFTGFLYAFAGKGKQGNADLKFFNEQLIRPYNAAMAKINNERMQLMDDFDKLKKDINSVPKKLKEQIPGEPFTYSHAIRVFAWTKADYTIPDLSAADTKLLNDIVKNDPDLLNFANTLININKIEGYPKPENGWLAGNIKTDLYGSLNKEKRSKHLEEWQQNVDIIFSEKNKAKMKAAFGNEFVSNVEGMLVRMKTGKNRKPGGNKMINGWLDWINGSVGAIMFVNMRSAVLQTISLANYINWSDNNLLAASKAFANQPQFWSDFKFIFNSDYLKERRGGLKLNVQESELAEQASKSGVKGVVSYILKQGFLPTRIADSFAISSGGASFYRNRIKKYTKEGLSQKEAETKAFQDFIEITEASQQSSRPDKISAQQASNLGRVLLAFANTPMQYNRLIKRSGQDLIAGRGDWKTNVSKIAYYTFLQNLIFNALQKGIFALGFGDDEVDDDKKKQKYIEISEGMLDSILRGVGITGQIAMSAKNVLKNVVVDGEIKLLDALYDLSPPINSKISKLKSAEYLAKYTSEEELKQLSIRNPGLMAVAYVLSAIANFPLDRALRKSHNLESAISEETEVWQKIALVLGWNEWELGVGPEAKKETKKIDPRSDSFRKSTREKINKRIEKIRNR